jgi:hypothetical protein
MSSEHTDRFAEPSRTPPMADDANRREAMAERREANAERREAMAERREAAVERRETTAEQHGRQDTKADAGRGDKSAEGDKPSGDQQQTKSSSKDGEKTPAQAKQQKPKEISPAKAKMQSRLPALDDDADVGLEKEQVVTRDGKADLAFTGTLLASAAPACATKGHWQEYRVYQTNGGKHVFAKVNRTLYVEEHDSFQAEVFDPAPASTTSQLLRTARDLTRSHPMTWQDAAVAFFGYDPLAKTLYRKLDGRFEERIS